jgi:prepilin-type N-terminal cleavage/methylation domain-containing protein/prepilin-type processing-associated H-X9-DG protein
MKTNHRLQTSVGFTLVELLVVIVIIATLAAISMTVIPKIKRSANEAKSVQNIRQIGSMIAVYSAENSSCLPALKAIAFEAGGVKRETDWYIALLALTYPDVELPAFSTTNWWETAEPVMRNPLLEKGRFKPWFSGYAMNYSLAVNATSGKTGAFGSGDGPDSQPIPLSRISDPARTPIVSTTRNWFYRAADLTALATPSSLDKSLLIDGKVPVLFVDGHVETMAPPEYITRNLGSMPTKP